MTLSQLSSQLRFDQAGALARFGGSEALLLRFLRRLPEDKTFAALSDAVAAGDLTGVERGAHTLKGVAANLGLDALRDASSDLVSAVRGGQTDQIAPLFALLSDAYQAACRDISQL
ncbi:Hpt domain-containing protein [Pseudoflavonifractor phocaeensis]|uniref:Hpt domain-containing protein n=1 Tax=Pseudoflavonifractor phocaeensis TaxID=1870988 RepID=UPI00195C48D0|nr:Hpt domain-containing protein [Pseudoflavonifractor phocaeensis]MBM6869681.1 Hpt domain-containing protein [Pseudoflavonifractor phocaeensis]MBM6938147.1 Hpt domain-containing protein [Pseudoflavonifractor phocaeensis]